MLQPQVKENIVAAAKQYIEEHNLQDADFATATTVSQSYLSAILKGKTITKAGEKEVVIKDSYYLRIAAYINFAVEKEYWEFVPTVEFKKMVVMLEEAKSQSLPKTIICSTGKGKTMVTTKFKKAHPLHTYVVTLHSKMLLPDVVNEILLQMRESLKGSVAERIRRIIVKAREIRRAGGRPIFIFDECENMNAVTMRTQKGLYDGLCQGGFASIVLMGTNQLLTKMERVVSRDQEAAPQFNRRFFKAALRVIPEVQPDKAFAPFFDKYKIHDRGLRKLLCELCSNYGELHDYLEPWMRKADQEQEDLTEEYFRMVYDMAA